jgi:hypothetical protein
MHRQRVRCNVATCVRAQEDLVRYKVELLAVLLDRPSAVGTQLVTANKNLTVAIAWGV